MGAGLSRPKAVRQIRPYNLRVTRKVSPGLWEVENNEGQLYLMVVARPWEAAKERLIEQRQASGEAYKGA